MKIKLAVITNDNIISSSILNFLNFDNLEKKLFKSEPDLNIISTEKFDVIIFDSQINSKWLQVFENIKHVNIKTIFIAIVEELTIDEVKSGFKKGIYEILRRDINKNELIRAVTNAINTATILKSNEKIHKYYKHQMTFILPTDVDLVNETVLQIIETAKLTGFITDRDMESNLRLAYTEAIINAMVHGNKSLRERKVKIETEITNTLIKVTIEDEGSGYNVKAIDNPLDSENLLKSSGRGIYLIKAIADEVYFEKNGSKIILINKKE